MLLYFLKKHLSMRAEGTEPGERCNASAGGCVLLYGFRQRGVILIFVDSQSAPGQGPVIRRWHRSMHS